MLTGVAIVLVCVAMLAAMVVRVWRTIVGVSMYRPGSSGQVVNEWNVHDDGRR